MESTERVHNGNMTKIDRYGWSIQDNKGELRWINKMDVQVDYSYQRNTNEMKLKNIARDWSWIACGAIVVANREGALFVVDGQHRVLAARKRSDITDLPCLVFTTSAAKQEAKGFLSAQTQRKPVTSIEKFKAMVVVEDPDALFIQSLADKYGIHIKSGYAPGYLKCVSSMLSHAKNDRETLAHIWPLVVDVSKNYAISERILEGLMHIEKRMPKGTSLMDKEWTARVLKVGAPGLLDAAGKASAYYAKGGPKVWASGMVEAINKNHRRLLELKE